MQLPKHCSSGHTYTLITMQILCRNRAAASVHDQYNRVLCDQIFHGVTSHKNIGVNKIAYNKLKIMMLDNASQCWEWEFSDLVIFSYISIRTQTANLLSKHIGGSQLLVAFALYLAHHWILSHETWKNCQAKHIHSNISNLYLFHS